MVHRVTRRTPDEMLSAEQARMYSVPSELLGQTVGPGPRP